MKSGFFPVVSSVSSSLTTKQPKIYFVGTGGTITGSGDSAIEGKYVPAKIKIEDLIAQLPSLNNSDVRLKSRDLFQIDSSDISTSDWLVLANTVNRLLKKPNVRGIVITHGTDTLEETAYFLDLVVKSDKPVVMVGAMRASTSVSADGPINLLNAASVVNSPESIGRGVLVVMNDTIFDARDVTKTHTTQVSTFSAPNSGPVGNVYYGKVEFVKQTIRKHTFDTPFDVSMFDSLPRVAIVYEHACQDGVVLSAVIATKPDGIVIAGTGNGNIPAKDKVLLQHARDQGIQIIRCSRTGIGKVTDDGVGYLDSDLGLISGDNLSPQKARILLMLSLTLTKSSNEIKNNFCKY